LAVMVITAMALELPHRNGREIFGERHEHLTVIGDSISAGIGGEAWPAIYAETTGVKVKNLSRAGMVVGDAMAMAKQVGPEDTLVLVELGGNDLLMDVPATDFQRDLDQLLQALRTSPPRRIVMIELPLLPHKILFGRIQRQLAKEHNVQLIPKRHFIHVLSGGDATTDGLHLSKTGATKMCELVDRFVGLTFAGKLSTHGTN